MVPQASVPKGELPGLQVDLVDELPCWRDDEGLGLLQLAEGTGGGAVCHQLLQDGEQEGGLRKREARQGQMATFRRRWVQRWTARSHRLARSRLGAGHEVSAGRDDRHAVFLHRGRLHVARLTDGFPERLAQRRLLKRLRGMRKRFDAFKNAQAHFKPQE